MAKLTLKSVTSRIGAIPVLPEVTTMVVRLMSDPESSARAVSNVVTRDPGLSAQILRLVNSAYFGLRNRVSDVTRAIALLGFDMVRGMVLSFSFLEMFRKLGAKRRDDFRRLWKHSAVSAAAAREMAKRMGTIESDVAFITGLLHDIGKLILMNYTSSEYKLILTRAEETRGAFVSAERALLDTTHADIAAWLAEKWNLAAEVAEGIRFHHTPEMYRERSLAGVCYVANHVCRMKDVTCAGTYDRETLDVDTWNSLGIAQEQYEGVLSAAAMEVELAEMILEMATTEKGGR